MSSSYPGGPPPQDWQNQGGPSPAPREDPGRTLGIVGLVLSFFTALIGMIVSIVALRRSRRAGFPNTPALIGVIVGAIGTVFAVIAVILLVIGLNAVAQKCNELGPGTHQENGVTYTCS